MDLVDYDEETFDTIVREFSDFARGLGARDIVYIPLSAKYGDNVVDRSENMPWYGGEPLLEYLEQVQVDDDRNLEDARFPVQWVIRTPDYRGYAGQVAGGVLSVGDEVVVLPSGRRSRIAAIDEGGAEVEEAFPPMSVALRLEDDVDVGRGDMIVRPDDAPEPAREVVADVCWMSDAPLSEGGRYAIKHTTRSARAVVDSVQHRIDVHTLRPDCTGCDLRLNDIGRVRFRLSAPLVADPYARNRTTGSFILVDETTNETVGAGMIV
jgi:sulfate adenylyltransferase subunit 1 (EFTu-like GTPase family)